MSLKLNILPVGNPDPDLIEWLAEALEDHLRLPSEMLEPMDVSFAYHPERKQYHSTELLEAVHAHVHRNCWRMLAVTEVDLYLPILTFVFGEAQLGGKSAIVSYHRLRQEYYGLPKNRDLTATRLLTEAVHELGHTLHLTHCRDHRCVMASSYTVELIDIKEPQFCGSCAERALLVS